jgi:AhpD family alkylhydroperoxidase
VQHSCRRRYRSLPHVWRDIRYIVVNHAALRVAMDGDCISPAFRERIMLAVTQVNGCSYCSYAHSRLALRAGVSPQELAEWVKGVIPAGTPDEEAVAVLYAQHWAESDACPDEAAVHRLIDVYGQERAGAIDMILRLIRAANLAGNAWDHLLQVLPFGHLPRVSPGIAASHTNTPAEIAGNRGDDRATYPAQLDQR